jgi:hypothetical protein
MPYFGFLAAASEPLVLTFTLADVGLVKDYQSGEEHMQKRLRITGRYIRQGSAPRLTNLSAQGAVCVATSLHAVEDPRFPIGNSRAYAPGQQNVCAHSSAVDPSGRHRPMRWPRQAL